MKKNYIYNLCSGMMSLFIGLTSCDNDKDLGDPMSESITISSIIIEETNHDVLEGGICLLRNKELQLSYIMKPEQVTNPNVQWTSSDETIVTVTQEGKLIAKDKCGKATIRLVPEIGFGPITATPSRTVEVLDHFDYIESIQFTNVPNDDIAVGGEYQLKVAAEPQNATFIRYKWNSSNPQVATVDKHGVVTGTGKGKVVITATADDLNPGTPATTAIELGVKVVIPIQEIELIEDAELSQLGYGQDYQIKYNLTPADATASLLMWTSDNESVVSVDKNGQLHVNSMTNGSAVITAASGMISKTVTVSVAEGRLWYSFANSLSPCVVDNNATSKSDGVKSTVQMGKSGTKYRGDFALVKNGSKKNLTITPAVYQYVAVKMRPRSVLLPGNNSEGCIKLELYDDPLTIGYNYTGSQGNGNNAFSILDGTKVSITDPNIFYYDLMSKFDNKNPTDRTKFNLVQFKLVIADYQEYASTYDIYWMRSFKTLEELRTFVQNENNK